MDKLDREEWKIILEILIKGEQAAYTVSKVLFTKDDSLVEVRGYEEGFFGNVTKLYKIVHNHSKYDTEKTVAIVEDSSLSLDEKVDILF